MKVHPSYMMVHLTGEPHHRKDATPLMKLFFYPKNLTFAGASRKYKREAEKNNLPAKMPEDYLTGPTVMKSAIGHYRSTNLTDSNGDVLAGRTLCGKAWLPCYTSREQKESILEKEFQIKLSKCSAKGGETSIVRKESKVIDNLTLVVKKGIMDIETFEKLIADVGDPIKATMIAMHRHTEEHNCTHFGAFLATKGPVYVFTGFRPTNHAESFWTEAHTDICEDRSKQGKSPRLGLSDLDALKASFAAKGSVEVDETPILDEVLEEPTTDREKELEGIYKQLGEDLDAM